MLALHARWADERKPNIDRFREAMSLAIQVS